VATHRAPATAPVVHGLPSAKHIFDPTRVHVIHLSLLADGWRMMQPNSGSPPRPAKPATTRPATQPTHADVERHHPSPRGLAYPYVRAAVEFDGTRLADAGLRFKGNASYAVSASAIRRPMKLEFDRFVEGGKLAGLTTLNLNNAASDPSIARETVTFAIFREMGMPAPRTGYALVYLTVPGQFEHEYLGLYTLIEEVDHHFLKRNFDRSDGLVLKPEGMRGMAYLGDQWATGYARYNPRSDVDPQRAARVIALAKLINKADDATFAGQIGSYLDVPEFLRYVAVNSAIANLDSFLSTGHNYFLYFDPIDNRGRAIPWDMNLSFGGYSWVGSAEQQQHMSVTHAYADHNRLIERLLAVEAYERRYRADLSELAEGPMSESRMRERRLALEPVFAAADRAAQESGRVGSPTTQPSIGMRLVAPELWSFVEARTHSIRRQLAGSEKGFLPGFRDPSLVPTHMIKVAPVAMAAMAAMDRDGDGRLSEVEVLDGIDRLLATARAGSDRTIDQPAATAAIDKLLTGRFREQATATAWAAWLFHVADANHDGHLSRDEMMAAFRRHLSGVDHDVDGLMDGREIVESFVGIGPPN
jgi:hypothetical protein